MHLHPDEPLTGRMRIFKTHHAIAQQYNWPKMRSYVRRYVSHCEICLKVKPINDGPYALYEKKKDLSDSWEVILTDIMRPLPRSPKGNSFFAVKID